MDWITHRQPTENDAHDGMVRVKRESNNYHTQYTDVPWQYLAQGAPWMHLDEAAIRLFREQQAQQAQDIDTAVTELFAEMQERIQQAEAWIGGARNTVQQLIERLHN